MAVNDQYKGEFFPGLTAGADSGAPGSAGVADAPPGVGGGAVIASPRVFPTGMADGDGRARVAVPTTQGDTSSFSDDMPVHSSPIMAADPADMLSTGAGQGHTDAWSRKPGQQRAGGQ